MKSTPMAMPSLESIYPTYREEAKVKQHARHNIALWRDTHGGLATVQKYSLDFDPRTEYWYQTERRVLVSYLAERFGQCYAPAEALRRLASRTFLHFDRARTDGRLGEIEVARRHPWGWSGLLSAIQQIAAELPKWRSTKHFAPSGST